MRAPARWLDEPDALPDELLAGMRVYGQSGPTAGELARLRADLAANTSLPSLWLVKSLAIFAVVGSIAAWSWLSAPQQPLVSALHETAPAQIPIEPAASPTPAPQLVAPEAAAARAAPELQPRTASRKSRSVLPRAAPGPEANVDPAAELAILQRARRALAVAPLTSLALTVEHARRYPRGAFNQERDLIAIEALAHTDRPAAIARARAFATQYPNSAHRPRIEVLLADR